MYLVSHWRDGWTELFQPSIICTPKCTKQQVTSTCIHTYSHTLYAQARTHVHAHTHAHVHDTHAWANSARKMPVIYSLAQMTYTHANDAHMHAQHANAMHALMHTHVTHACTANLYRRPPALAPRCDAAQIARIPIYNRIKPGGATATLCTSSTFMIFSISLKIIIYIYTE